MNVSTMFTIPVMSAGVQLLWSAVEIVVFITSILTQGEIYFTKPERSNFAE
jgi:hypothetical protein